ncbi:GNAT family N-acetyltransferase [uncultured Faecalibaculum sp.]|uniref:GNAT family N-acetyltransferase n=1 Tax=uncultured Faecalibaculum sp. TaxID=1729681 RepID=UPI00261DBAFA|nr:GNAT family N-acetyltransferase [uncultured Faecalibaculum sp.]
MEIRKADMDMADEIRRVLQITIQTVYPRYYPKEVVDFFCRHHSLEHVLNCIQTGNMRVVMEGERILGVGALDGNHITGLYVLPECQGTGCGTRLMEALEKEISRICRTAVLEASLPGMMLYEHRGYRTIGHGMLNLEHEICLVYEIMEKEL